MINLIKNFKAINPSAVESDPDSVCPSKVAITHAFITSQSAFDQAAD